MLKLNKKRIAIILAFVMLQTNIFVLSGCFQNENNPQGSDEPEKEKSMDMGYWVENPIKIKEIKLIDTAENLFSSSKLEISGLADVEIEKKINDRITEAYEKINEDNIPPYRGIRRNISENDKITSKNISMYATGNFNNILSIMINKYVEQNNTYYSEINTLNFDLRTGEELTLEDVFKEKSDYISILSDEMAEYIKKYGMSDEGISYMGEGMGFSMVSPFKGIKKEQKFVLYPNFIGLIFDYNNPEFSLNSNAMVVTRPYFDFRDEIALKEKVSDKDKELYSSNEPKSLMLVRGQSDNNKRTDIDNSYGAVRIYATTTYPESMPKILTDRINAMNVFDEEILAKMKKGSEIDPQQYFSYEVYVNGYHIGKYFIIMYSTIYAADTFWENQTKPQCFDLKGNEIKLPDLFVADFDYETPIKEALATEKLNYTDYLQKDYTVDELYNDMYFEIAENGLGIYTKNIYAFVPYVKFGCENMTIF